MDRRREGRQSLFELLAGRSFGLCACLGSMTCLCLCLRPGPFSLCRQILALFWIPHSQISAAESKFQP